MSLLTEEQLESLPSYRELSRLRKGELLLRYRFHLSITNEHWFVIAADKGKTDYKLFCLYIADVIDDKEFMQINLQELEEEGYFDDKIKRLDSFIPVTLDTLRQNPHLFF